MIKALIVVVIMTSLVTIIGYDIVVRLWTSTGTVRIEQSDDSKDKMIIDLTDDVDYIRHSRYLKLKVINTAKKTGP